MIQVNPWRATRCAFEIASRFAGGSLGRHGRFDLNQVQRRVIQAKLATGDRFR
ncbi:MAG: hypothetical protein IT530_09430 [Burkholderiales bacterium]|nr:hypothetical protein [Burkholderiales bacterium]